MLLFKVGDVVALKVECDRISIVQAREVRHWRTLFRKRWQGTELVSSPFVSRPGQRLELRTIGDQLLGLVDGVVVLSIPHGHAQ
jgi:hypothetical protein